MDSHELMYDYNKIKVHPGISTVSLQQSLEHQGLDHWFLSSPKLGLHSKPVNSDFTDRDKGNWDGLVGSQEVSQGVDPMPMAWQRRGHSSPEGVGREGNRSVEE